jgi:hypothetical protein
MKAEQKDNTTLLLKASLRRQLIREIKGPVVLETHGGYGKLFDLCYSQLREGVVFEKHPQKADYLAKQRPTWAVYEADSLMAISERVGNHLPINFLDIDPYGSPWEIINAFFYNWIELPPVLGIAVNDGLRQKLKMQGGWSVGALEEIVSRYGNQGLFKNYKEICQEMLSEKAAQVGYRLDRWVAYYCGYQNQMTHYGAVLIMR